jgi:hypothetical protein
MAWTPKTRDVWHGAREILLSDAPNLDASEHVGLLTVVAGIRRVALFLDVADLKVKKLVRLLGTVDLIAFVARVPEPVCTWELPYRSEIASVFRGKLQSFAFWVCCEKHDANTINKGIDQIADGRLLGYPECCIDAQRQDNAEFEGALVQGWTRQFGDDPERIAQAWHEGRKVGIEFEPKAAHECLAHLRYFRSCSTLLVNLAWGRETRPQRC